MAAELDLASLDFAAAGRRCHFTTAARAEVDGSGLWDAAAAQLPKIARLTDGWDGDGAPPIHPVIAASASRLLRQLRANRFPGPNDVYPVPDGTVVAEWQFADGVILRIEADGPGRGDLMVSYPSAPTRFERVVWDAGPVPEASPLAEQPGPAALELQHPLRGSAPAAPPRPVM